MTFLCRSIGNKSKKNANLFFFAFLFILVPSPQFIYAAASSEEYSVILEREEHYYNIALEKAIIGEAHNNNIEATVHYINPENYGEQQQNIVKENIKKSIPITILRLDSQENLNVINDIIVEQGTLEHSIVNYTHITSQFFSSLVFIDAMPSIQKNPLVPWGFIGYDISALVDTQLDYIRSKQKNDEIHILIVVLQDENILQSKWLAELKKQRKANENLYVEYVENSDIQSISSALQNSAHYSFYGNTSHLHLISLYDESSINTSIVLNTIQNNNQREAIALGFGGSQEAKLAIQEGLLSMSITPDYEEYSKKIIDLAQGLMIKKSKLIAENYLLDTNQEGNTSTIVSFSIME